MKTFTALLLLLFLTATAPAEVLVEQTSIPIGNPNSGSTAVASTKANVILQQSQAWDNFVISEPVSITDLHWSGAYYAGFNPDGTRGTTDFVVQFLPDVADAPDISSPIATFELDGGLAGMNDGTDVSEMLIPNQSTSKGGLLYRYESELAPFELSPGTYWLSIQAQQTLPSDPAVHDDPEWAWVLAADGDKGAFSYDELFDPIGTQPGVRFEIDTTFTLFGDPLVTQLEGDFDDNGLLEAADIDMLAAAVRNNSNDARFDLTNDGNVTLEDHTYWVETLKGTYRGDTDLDGEIAFNDFVELATNFGLIGGWGMGNFDTDEEIAFADFLHLSRNFGMVANDTAGGEPDSLASAVPEPSSMFALCFGGLLALGMHRRRYAL